jgi:hypothetical protein
MADAPGPPDASASDSDLSASSSGVGKERIASEVSGGAEQERDAMEGASVTVMAVDGIAEPAEEPAARQNGNATLSTLERIIPYVIVHILEYVDLPPRVKCASLSNTLHCLLLGLWSSVKCARLSGNPRFLVTTLQNEKLDY